MFSLALLLAPAALGQDLTLEIHLSKAEILLGEPVVVVGTARSRTAAAFDARHGLHTLVDRGSGFVEIGKKWAMAQDAEPATVTSASTAFEEVVAFDVRAGEADPSGDWVFPRPGVYRVAVEHSWRDTPRVRSNVVSVTVRAPQGDEAAVWAEIARQPEVRDYLSYQECPGPMPTALVTLVEKAPQSAYLQRARAQEFARRAVWALEGCDPSDPRLCSLAPGERPAAIRLQVTALLSRADAFRGQPNPWAPDVLRVIAHLQSALGDGTGRQVTLRRLAMEYPEREAGRWAQRELED